MEGCGAAIFLLIIGAVGIIFVIALILRELLGFFGLVSGGYFGSRRYKQQPDKGQSINGNMLQWETPSKQALINYIRLSRQDGVNDMETTSILKDKNWTDDEIKEAFNAIKI